jgi:hypothetical protein
VRYGALRELIISDTVSVALGRKIVRPLWHTNRYFFESNTQRCLTKMAFFSFKRENEITYSTGTSWKQPRLRCNQG